MASICKPTQRERDGGWKVDPMRLSQSLFDTPPMAITWNGISGAASAILIGFQRECQARGNDIIQSQRFRLGATCAIVAAVLGLAWIVSRPPELEHRPLESPLAGSAVGEGDAGIGEVGSGANSESLNEQSILFIGNSHSQYHQLPERVAQLLRYRNSERTITAETFSVGFLDEVHRNPALVRKIKSGHWDIVVLQAQKISSSGRIQYSTEEGTELARWARESGSKVFFFAEWGIADDVHSTRRTLDVYRTMAKQAQVQLIPVGQAWQDVLRDHPNMPLYSNDGNHQSTLGCSLSALVIASFLSSEPASVYAAYQDPVASGLQWRAFVSAAVEIFEIEHSK